GKTYHFLTLSVLYRGVSVPIWWHDLAKLGISSQQQRKRMLQSALKVLNLVGDREYIGTQWFEMLHQAGIGVVVRLRKGNYQSDIEQRGHSVNKLENRARSRVGQVVWKQFTLQDHRYYYVLKAYHNRSGKIEYLRLISSVTPALAIECYRQRYRIEAMFKHLKSNAFDLEALHVRQAYKIRMMMALVVLAYTLSVCYGLAQYKRRIAIKKHGSAQVSVLRHGLDKWQNYLQSFVVFLEHLSLYLDSLTKHANKRKLLLNQIVP
ncbi:transposase, partial [Catalinimonas sp. 4WD22]|uniref:transposase n=1 Tax=Catalinimonas locisalis TaxID=3133978 RepID=UPI00310199A4